jgi:hypothetical protein
MILGYDWYADRNRRHHGVCLAVNEFRKQSHFELTLCGRRSLWILRRTPRRWHWSSRAPLRRCGGRIHASPSRQAGHYWLGSGQWVARQGDYRRKGAARVAHYLCYIEHWSRWSDLKILLKAVSFVSSGGAW